MTSSATEALVRRFMELYPGEVARKLELVDAPEIAATLEQSPGPVATEIVRRMQPDRAAATLDACSEARRRELLQRLDPVLAANLLARVPQQRREQILLSLPDTTSDEFREILQYPPGTAGNLMEANVATFPMDMSVEHALERVRTLRDRRIADLVVVDDDLRFRGAVRLQDIVGAPPEQTLAELQSPTPVSVTPMTPRADVVEVLSRLRLASLPVVDLEHRVVGIIRHTGLVEAAQQDLASDIQQMVGGSAEERALSRPWVGVRSRLPWLYINLLTAFAAASVVGLFEDTIARFTALAVLLPVVAGQSGNTGAQALAVTMRGLALREIRVTHAPRVLVKESAIGLINGLGVATGTALAVFAWSRNLGLVIVMFLAMVVSMLAASVAGAAIPVLLVKLGRDPATASSIILTTVTDIAGFFSFLGLAAWLSHMLG